MKTSSQGVIDMEKNEELNIINKILEGDKKSFRVLLEAYDKRIYGFIYKIIRDSYISQDLTQETFIKVYKNIHTYDKTKEFSTWIYTIAKNECFKYLRKVKKVSLVEINDNILINIFNKLTPEVLLEKKEDNKMMLKIIDALPKKYREVIILKYFEDLSYKEISEHLNISEKKVESWLYLARKNITKQYSKYNKVGQVINLWNVTK